VWEWLDLKLGNDRQKNRPETLTSEAAGRSDALASRRKVASNNGTPPMTEAQRPGEAYEPTPDPSDSAAMGVSGKSVY